jgi:hypothetical protein
VNFRGKGAAKYLGVSEAWLRKARQDKADPPYVRIGRTIIYRKADLDEFLESHLKRPEGGTEGVSGTQEKRKSVARTVTRVGAVK